MLRFINDFVFFFEAPAPITKRICDFVFKKKYPLKRKDRKFIKRNENSENPFIIEEKYHAKEKRYGDRLKSYLLQNTLEHAIKIYKTPCKQNKKKLSVMLSFFFPFPPPIRS